MSDNINNFLTDLKNLTNKKTVKIKVPSLDREVEFKPLTVKQQKDALKANLSGATGSISFLTIVNDIIEENAEEDIDFTIQDRTFIILQLRNSALGNKYTKNGKDYYLNVEYTKLPSVEKLTAEHSGIKLILEIPTLKKDTTIARKCIQEVKTKKIEDIGEVVDVLYAYEIMKFIKAIEFGTSEVNFLNLNTKDKKEVIDLLPLALNRIVLQIITDIKSYDKPYLTIDGEELALDVSLLTSD